MDYSKFSDETLKKISNNEPLDYSKLSDTELEEITKSSQPKVAQTVNVPPTQQSPTQITQLESALRGAGDYGLFGFEDEAVGALKSLLSNKTYEQARDEEREANRMAAEENPLTYHGSGIAAGFALPIGGLGGMATKGVSRGGAFLRSALSGAGMGALAGAGQAENLSDIPKEVATGALAGAVVAPALEGSLTALGKLGKATYENISPIKAVLDTAKYAAQGERIAGEEGSRLTTEKAKNAAEDLVKELKLGQEYKNQSFRSSEQLSKVQTNVSEIQDLINKAIDTGVDPKIIKPLQIKLDKLSGKTEQVVTDPTKYNQMFSEEINKASEELKIKTYEKLQNDLEKRALIAEKEAQKSAELHNKNLLNEKIKEIRVKSDVSLFSNKELKEKAIQELKNNNLYIDPIEAAKNARSEVLSTAENVYSPSIKQSPVTKTAFIETPIGKDKAIRSPLPMDVDEHPNALLKNISSAGINIEKLADTNSAQAFALAERENKKSIDKLTKLYSEQNMLVNRDDIITELKNSNKWIDPKTSAKTAKEITLAGELDRPLIETFSQYSPEINRQVMSSKIGDDTIIRKILPKMEFKENVFTKENLTPKDLNELKQLTSKMDTNVYGQSSGMLNDLKQSVNDLYKKSISKEANIPLHPENADLSAFEKPYQIDQTLRTTLAKLGISEKLSTPKLSEDEFEKLSLDLLKQYIKAGESKGSIEYKQTKDAMRQLIDLYPENSPQKAKLQEAIKNMEETSYKSFLSDITRGHNTFAISPSNLNWTMTAAGKLGFAAEAAGATYRGIIDSPPGKLLNMANKIREKGYQKYADTLNKIAGTEDVNKRRALTFTLLQNPEFRKLMSPDLTNIGND